MDWMDQDGDDECNGTVGSRIIALIPWILPIIHFRLSRQVIKTHALFKAKNLFVDLTKCLQANLKLKCLHKSERSPPLPPKRYNLPKSDQSPSISDHFHKICQSTRFLLTACSCLQLLEIEKPNEKQIRTQQCLGTSH